MKLMKKVEILYWKAVQAKAQKGDKEAQEAGAFAQRLAKAGKEPAMEEQIRLSEEALAQKAK